MKDHRQKFPILTLLCTIGLFLSGCNREFDQTDSGLRYKFIEKGTGLKPQKGEFLILDLLIKSQGDSIIYSTAGEETYFPVRYDPYKQKIGLDNMLDEGFYMLGLRDSAIFQFPASALYNLAFKVPGPIKKDEMIIAETRVIAIYTYEEYAGWKKEALTRKKEKYNRVRNKTLQAQIADIEAHLQSLDEIYDSTASGIRYVITHPGIGRSPVDGDSVSFSYEVTYFDGAKIEGGIGSSGDGPKSIKLGTAGVFDSWQESIKLLKPGGSGRFYIPSPLAFGESGGYGIKPNAILIVEMELAGIKEDIAE